MLRQALLVPSRAFRSTTRAIAQRPLSRAQTLIAPVAVPRIQPLAARWYSDAPKETKEGDKKDGDADATPVSEGQAAAENPEDPVLAELQKKFETKDKEAAEWKVRGACSRTPFPKALELADIVHRTNAFAPSPTSATCKTAPSARSRTPASLPSRASPRISWTAWTTWTGRSRWCPRQSWRPRTNRRT